MNRIDAHQHFWDYRPEVHTWMDARMDVLKRDYSPSELHPLLMACELDGCIAVQASQTEEENEFLLSLAKLSPFIKGIVGWVDLQAENLADRLHHYSQHPLIKGFRHIIHDEPELDFMLRPAFVKGIKSLSDFGYTYDILIFERHLPNTQKFLEHVEDQRLVVDHIAKPDMQHGQFKSWQKGLQAIAAFPNVYCKISGMVTEAKWKAWSKSDFTRYLDGVVEAFGLERIMYGSDWPVCTLSATYEEQYAIVANYFSAFSKSEQDNFFGGNAHRFYKL